MSLMQIPRKIEYALRAMIYLADHPAGVARGTEIATREQIPKYYLEKVIRDLMRRGLVHARRGPGGGYQLARKADTITLRGTIANPPLFRAKGAHSSTRGWTSSTAWSGRPMRGCRGYMSSTPCAPTRRPL